MSFISIIDEIYGVFYDFFAIAIYFPSLSSKNYYFQPSNYIFIL